MLDMPPPKPPHVRIAREDVEHLTADKVCEFVRQTRVDIPVVSEEEAVGAKSLEDSSELTPEKVREKIRKTCEAANEHARRSDTAVRRLIG